MKITEKQLKKIISESVKKVIAEEMAAPQAPAQSQSPRQLLEAAWRGLIDMRGAIVQLHNNGVIPDILRDEQVNAAYIKMQNSLTTLANFIK